MRWFVRGDIDGFFGLALDNLVQLLLIDSLCRAVLGFNSALIYGHVLPAVAVSLLIGNLFYAWQAKELAYKTRRRDVCALPYGINTVSLIAHVFLVMLPAKIAAQEKGMIPEVAAEIAWQAGLVACLGSGVIEFVGAFFAQSLRKITPRAALLSTLAGIALGFIAMSFLFRTFARPVIGLTTLGIILLTYFGAVRFKGGIPGGLVAVGLGTAIAWLTGISPPKDMVIDSPNWYPPVPVIGHLMKGLADGQLWTHLSIIVPMGLFNLIGSLQNIESAEAAGDSYAVAPSLATNGIGSIVASLFGSCFPTTIYIGHPGWKALGARAGYSILNAVFFTIVCLTGVLGYITYAVPIDAGMAIVLYIGIVITAQAFQATPREHAPAVVIGLLPGIAAWGALMAKQALQVGGGAVLSEKLIPEFQKIDNWIDGAFALSEGFIFTSMILAATTVAIIERKFRAGAAWCFAGAVLSAIGLMHSYRFAAGGTALDLTKRAWDWALGYAIMGLFLLIAPYVTEPGEGH
jgi:AGZA family xanthine/uracil permease-like MFS transporter